MRKVAVVAVMAVIALVALGQQYDFEHDAVLVENRASAFVVRSSGHSADKKKAVENAAMGALDAYLFNGIEGVNGGKPLLAESARELKPGYFERLYREGRYSVFARVLTEKPKVEKLSDGKFGTTVEVSISFKALQRDIATSKLPQYGSQPQPASQPVMSAATTKPTVMILPNIEQNARYTSWHRALTADPLLRTAIESLASRLAKRGFKVVDFERCYKQNTAAAEADVVAQSDAQVIIMADVAASASGGTTSLTVGLNAYPNGSSEPLNLKNRIKTPRFKAADATDLCDIAAMRALTDDYIASLTTAWCSLSAATTPQPVVKPQPVEENLDPVDVNLPQATALRENTFAVVIGNEDYKYVAPVTFARRDAEIFAKYCRVTLGMPDDNVRLYTNATYADLLDAIDDIKTIARAYSGDISVIFYYAGHGVPSASSRNAFLLPVDSRANQFNTSYSIEKLYSELSGLGARSVTVLLDACFSGSLRGEGMLESARGTVIKPRDDEPSGSMVAITATTGDQTAYPYTEKRHGMFTYYLLLKLQQSGGNVTLGDLSDYIIGNVSRQSSKNRKLQTPTVVPSPDVEETWRKFTLH
ncbi:MAG: DUF6175 family protein [Bacteroidales bacterium]|nr:DUF6175 family protein [Bacteroidales bacterium]